MHVIGMREYIENIKCVHSFRRQRSYIIDYIPQSNLLQDSTLYLLWPFVDKSKVLKDIILGFYTRNCNISTESNKFLYRRH